MRPPTTGSAAPDLGVYVHVPFCERVCPYCDFAVVGVRSLRAEVEHEFVAALLAELERAVDALGLAGRRLATLYLGGGTPSLLGAESVARLVEGVCAHFSGPPAEVTLELNPGRVEVARIPGFRSAGVTRVSVGVQALDDTVLRRLGRAHRAAEARAGLEACLATGFATLSADLIYGAPGQGLESLLAGARALVALGVPHVSAYALTLEPGTPFARAQARGQLALPDEAGFVTQGEELAGALESAGLERYEISSWARPGHRSQHNQRYWLRHDVLGIGPSAASLIGSRRFQNTRALGDWQGRISQGGLAWCESLELSADAERREALYLGLRRIDGVDLAGYAARYGAEPGEQFAAELAELENRGLVETRGGALRLSARGRLFADEVFVALVESA